MRIFRWFNENLERPARFSRKPRRQPKAVCWFKPSAKEHLKRIWELVAILESNDVLVHLIKTKTPGYVVYEDDFQLVAEPFIDLKRRERR